MAHLEEALRLKPDYAEAHNNLANALAMLGRHAEAQQHLERGLQLNPDSPEIYNNLAIELATAGRNDEAIQCFQRAIELNPAYPDAHNNLAIELAHSNRLPEAIEHFQEAVRLKPNYLDAHKNLAHALLRADRPAEAVDQYLQALRLKPDDAGNLRQRAQRLSGAEPAGRGHRHGRKSLGSGPLQRTIRAGRTNRSLADELSHSTRRTPASARQDEIRSKLMQTLFKYRAGRRRAVDRRACAGGVLARLARRIHLG